MSANVQFVTENGLVVRGTANVEQDLRVEGNLYVGGQFLAAIQSNGDLIPVTTGLRLGNTTNRWVISGTTGNFSANVTAPNFIGNVSFSSITNKPSPKIALTFTGHVTGSGNVTLNSLGDGSSTISLVHASNSVTLGIHTTGNYVATIANGAGIEIYGSGSESANVTITNKGVLSFNGRTGGITLNLSDVTTALGYVPFDRAGGTILGQVNVNANVVVTSEIRLEDPVNRVGIELGKNAVQSISYIDFHASNTVYVDYDVRLKAQNPTGTSAGAQLNIEAGSLTLNNNTIWHTGNDGSGSGLDADTVDGVHAATFARLDQTQTFTGSPNIFRMSAPSVGSDTTGNLGILSIYQANSTVGDAFMAFQLPGHAFYFGIDRTTNDLFVGGWSKGATKNKVWHAGNDGAASGLDADLLDGQQGSYYLSWSNLTGVPSLVYNNGGSYGINITGDAGTLGGLNSASFVRSDAASTVSANTEWQDNAQIQIGTGSDTRIWHNGTHTYIDHYTGDLYIRDGTTTRFTFSRTSGNFQSTGLIYGRGGGSGLGRITLSTSTPSGGAAGDLWFQY